MDKVYRVNCYEANRNDLLNGRTAKLKIVRNWIASSVEKVQESIRQIGANYNFHYYEAIESELDKINIGYSTPSISYFFDSSGEMLTFSNGKETDQKKKFYNGEVVYVIRYESCIKIGKIVQILTDDYRVVILDSDKEVERIQSEYILKVPDRDMELMEQATIKRLEEKAKAFRNRKKIKAVVDERRKDLSDICHCFNYQDECPAEFVGTIKEQFWAAERNIIREHFDCMYTMSREWLDEQLLDYFSSWENDELMRSFGEILFEEFPAPDYQDRLIQKYYKV